jgi:hypothetical protein
MQQTVSAPALPALPPYAYFSNRHRHGSTWPRDAVRSEQLANARTMTIEFHPESDGGTVKTPDDTVTIDLLARTVS